MQKQREKCTSPPKNYAMMVMQGFYHLCSGQISTLIIKSWVSVSAPVLQEFENHCLISVLGLVSGLQLFVNGDQGMTDNSFLVSMPLIIKHRTAYGPSTICTLQVEKIMANKTSLFSTFKHLQCLNGCAQNCFIYYLSGNPVLCLRGYNFAS